MLKSTKTVFTGMWRLRRGTATVMGRAVMLAVGLGVTTAANAAAVFHASNRKGSELEMKSAIEVVRQGRRIVMLTAALVSAGLLLALAGTSRDAEATSPGENGRIAFASNRTTGEEVNNPEGDYEIFTMKPDGSSLTQLTENAASDFDPEWSPDGQKIAFESDRNLFSNIFLMNADGTEQSQVTDGRSFDRSATFSPDGKRIAFDSNLEAGEGVDNPEGDFEVFSVRVDGTGLAQLTRNGEADFQADFAPDGKRIAFVSRRDFRSGIYTMNVDGSKQKKIDRGSGVAFASPGWSPDGAKIAFTSDQEGGSDVYVMRANGAGQERLTVNGLPTDSGPVFSPDGARISFQTNRDGNFEIYTMNPGGSGLVNLTKDPAGDFAPDWQALP